VNDREGGIPLGSVTDRAESVAAENPEEIDARLIGTHFFAPI
jgi:hypothetical protein